MIVFVCEKVKFLLFCRFKCRKWRILNDQIVIFEWYFHSSAFFRLKLWNISKSCSISKIWLFPTLHRIQLPYAGYLNSYILYDQIYLWKSEISTFLCWFKCRKTNFEQSNSYLWLNSLAFFGLEIWIKFAMKGDQSVTSFLWAVSYTHLTLPTKA